MMSAVEMSMEHIQPISRTYQYRKVIPFFDLTFSSVSGLNKILLISLIAF